MKTRFDKLQEIDKTNPFSVPENYFSEFNKEIMDLLPEKEFVAPKTVSMWDRVKPWVYMAAMFIGFYFIINFLMPERTGTDDTINTASTQQVTSGFADTDNYWSTVHVTEEEFYLYLEEQLIDDGYFDLMYDQYYLN